MQSLQKALPHLITAISVIAALTLLAIDHVISGGEAYGGIIGAGGFTLGGTVASSSISTAATAAVDVSHSAQALAATPTQKPSTVLPNSEQVAATNPPSAPTSTSNN